MNAVEKWVREHHGRLDYNAFIRSLPEEYRRLHKELYHRDLTFSDIMNMSHGRSRGGGGGGRAGGGAATSVGKDTKARKNPFQGKFSDPAHSDMTRTIKYAGGRDYQISGADEDKKPWKVFGKRKNSATLIVDFTPKGGPAEVGSKGQVGCDIKFPDGNVWKRLD